MSNSNKFLLCMTSDIPDPGSMGFELETGDEPRKLFIVHKDGEFFAYQNSCPHTGAPLEWVEHQFLDMGNDFIQCSTHDALFEVPTGLCIKGPCAGASLSGMSLKIEDDQLYVHME